MHAYTPRLSPTLRHLQGASIALVTAMTLVVIGGSTASAVATAIELDDADSFVVLAGTGVTATGPITLNGDLGSFPDSSVTGFGTITINGVDHAGDGVTQDAKLDLVGAFDALAGQGPTLPIVGDLAGLTLTPGVYNSASQILLTGELTLDAGGDPNAVWVFQAGSDLIVNPGASVALTNGAQACNVYWEVGSSATLDTGVSFKGTVIALTSITANTGATVVGRLLARNGTVTLDSNTITRPACAVAPRGEIRTGDGSTYVESRATPLDQFALPVTLGIIAVLLIVGLAYVGTRRNSRHHG